MRATGILAFTTLISLALGASTNTASPEKTGKVVTFDVVVTDRNGNYISGLRRENFKVFEDKAEQPLTGFEVRQGPVAVVLLVESTDRVDESATAFTEYDPDFNALAAGFLRFLNPDDWVSLVSFGLRPQIITDFTRDKERVANDLLSLQTPDQRGAALSDAVSFVLDRMKHMEEKGAIILMSTGLDTASSKRTMVDALRKVAASNITIYTVSPARPAPNREADSNEYTPFGPDEGEYALRRLAETSGGLSFEPLSPGQYDGIYEAVISDLRHQYTLSFLSCSTKEPGKPGTLRVAVSGADINQNGKPDKLRVRHKTGF